MDINSLNTASFLISPTEVLQKFKKVRAIVSDWDGVFNNGMKNPGSPSPFFEGDSMGSNLLRFRLWSRDQSLAPVAIITGADNPSAQYLVKREHFQAYYPKTLDKAKALQHFCKTHRLEPQEVAVFFDDANDLAMAKLAGLRCLVPRPGGKAFQDYVQEEGLADYVCAQEGGNFAIREICETLMSLDQSYSNILKHRSQFSTHYQEYFSIRQSAESHRFKLEESTFIGEKLS